MRQVQPETEYAAPAAPESAARVPLGTVLSYGLPVIALSAPLFFVQFFFLNFATDVLLMSPLVVSVVFALGRAWDAVSDPIVGGWSDRTRTRLGRRRPWMLAAIPLLALTFAMIWMPPQQLGDLALTVWVSVALFGFYTAFTAYIVPHMSLGAELTTDHHDRSRVFGFRAVAFMTGMMPAFVGMQLVRTADDPRDMAIYVALGTAAVMSLLLLVPPVRIREREDYQGRGGRGLYRALRDVFKNPHARILILVQFIDFIGAGVLGILSPYMTLYVWKRPDLLATLPAVFVIATVLSIPFWVRASRRFGKRDVWRVAMVGSALSFGGTFFVGEGEIPLITVLLLFAGISSGCGSAVGPSVMADIIDYDEYQSGERKEGAYSATNGFAIKTASALIILITGLFLQLSGFEPNVEQSDGMKLAFRSIYAGTPLLMFLTGALLFGRFRLDQREHERIRAELDARHAE